MRSKQTAQLCNTYYRLGRWILHLPFTSITKNGIHMFEGNGRKNTWIQINIRIFLVWRILIDIYLIIVPYIWTDLPDWVLTLAFGLLMLNTATIWILIFIIKYQELILLNVNSMAVFNHRMIKAFGVPKYVAVDGLEGWLTFMTYICFLAIGFICPVLMISLLALDLKCMSDPLRYVFSFCPAVGFFLMFLFLTIMAIQDVYVMIAGAFVLAWPKSLELWLKEFKKKFKSRRKSPYQMKVIWRGLFLLNQLNGELYSVISGLLVGPVILVESVLLTIVIYYAKVLPVIVSIAFGLIVVVVFFAFEKGTRLLGAVMSNAKECIHLIGKSRRKEDEAFVRSCVPFQAKFGPFAFAIGYGTMVRIWNDIIMATAVNFLIYLRHR